MYPHIPASVSDFNDQRDVVTVLREFCWEPPSLSAPLPPKWAFGRAPDATGVASQAKGSTHPAGAGKSGASERPSPPDPIRSGQQ